MKRIVSVLLSVLLIASLCGCATSQQATGSGSTGDPAATGASQPSGDGTTIKLLNGKIEIDEQIRNYAALYEEQYGVRVEVESVAGADVTTYLTSYLVSGEMPDIFYFGGESDYQILKEYMADLSDQSWAEETFATFTGENGEVVGFPYAVEGFGMVYNADILNQAGIDPAGLTTIDAYRAAFETLESKKEELGIDAPVSMASSIATGCSWITGMHQTGIYLGQGLEADDDSLLQLMKEGKVDKERLNQYAEWEARSASMPTRMCCSPAPMTSRLPFGPPARQRLSARVTGSTRRWHLTTSTSSAVSPALRSPRRKQRASSYSRRLGGLSTRILPTWKCARIS